MREIGPLEIGEVKAIRFDFSTEAAEVTTLSLPSVTCATLNGTDPAASAMLVGAPTIEDKEVVQVVQPGVVGCTYKLRAYVTDSSGLRHAMSTHLRVVSG